MKERSYPKPMRLSAILLAGLVGTHSMLARPQPAAPGSVVDADTAFQLEGVILFRLSNCSYSDGVKKHAVYLSDRARKAIAIQFPVTPEAAAISISNGESKAKVQMASDPEIKWCEIEQKQCLLSYMRDRDSVVAELVGDSTKGYPDDWPTTTSGCGIDRPNDVS